MGDERVRTARPLIRWVGGKTKLLDKIVTRLPALDENATYFEPFVGGGAVWLRLRPQRFVVNDANAELINFYTAVRDSPDELCRIALSFDVEKSAYYEIRAWDKSPTFLTDKTDVERAARFVYLNRTCWNGLWRVNSKNGYNNTPWGYPKADKKVCDRDDVMAVADYISTCDRAEFRCGTYEALEPDMCPGDVVYFDPPYVPISMTEAFVSYTTDGFSNDDQMRLRDMCVRLRDGGIHWALSNSWSPTVRDLYQAFQIEEVSVNRTMAAKASSRRMITEALVTSLDRS